MTRGLHESLVRSTVWYGLVTVLGLLMGVLMSVVLARGLGPSRMGDYSYLLWISRVLTALATLGFAVGTVRYTASALAEHDGARAWGVVELLRRRQLVVAILVAAATIALVRWLVSPDLRWPLAVVAVTLIPMTLEQIYMNALYGAHRYDLTGLGSTIKMALHLATAIVALALGLDILGLIVGMLTATIVAMAFQRRSARRLYPNEAAPVPEATRREMRHYLVPLSVVVVLETLVWDRCEVFFLRLSATSDDIAFYSLAFGLATKAMIAPEIAVGALLPTFSALHGAGTSAEFGRVYRSAIRYVALAAVPVAAITAGVAPALVALLYGDEYAPTAPLYAALAGIAALSSIRRVAWLALRGLGDRSCAVAATSVAAVINIGAAAWLVPLWGTWGAVVANSAAQVVATVWVLVVMGRVYLCGFPLLAVGRTGAAGALALAVTLVVLPGHAGVVGLVLASVAGAIAFLGAAAALGAVGAREWSVLLTSTRRLAARVV